MNIFQQLNNYINNDSNLIYGDILSNSNESKIPSILNDVELEIYNYIKESDKNRLLKFG